jgi:AraC-like DNA-binding protein
MAARKYTASVSLDLPRLLLKYAVGAGIDPDQVCEQIGLKAATLRDLEGRMSPDQFSALWETVAQRANDPNFGLHFGESAASYSSGHLLFAVMGNCATLGEALERFCRYHGLLADQAPPELIEEEHGAVFTFGSRLICRHYAEAILAMFSVVVGRLTENRVRPVQVRFAHRPPVALAEHQRVFGAPLLFNQPRNGLALNRPALHTPIFLANPALLATLEQFAQRSLEQIESPEPWTSRTCDAVRKLLLCGEKPQLLAVARALAISPRHLQNKLQAEGVSYQGLLDRVRKQMALDCLKRGEMTVCEIAFLLGFSEQSAFNHAFKRWTGTTPTEYSGA